MSNTISSLNSHLLLVEGATIILFFLILISFSSSHPAPPTGLLVGDSQGGHSFVSSSGAAAVMRMPPTFFQMLRTEAKHIHSMLGGGNSSSLNLSEELPPGVCADRISTGKCEAFAPFCAVENLHKEDRELLEHCCPKTCGLCHEEEKKEEEGGAIEGERVEEMAANNNQPQQQQQQFEGDAEAEDGMGMGSYGGDAEGDVNSDGGIVGGIVGGTHDEHQHHHHFEFDHHHQEGFSTSSNSSSGGSMKIVGGVDRGRGDFGNQDEQMGNEQVREDGIGGGSDFEFSSPETSTMQTELVGLEDQPLGHHHEDHHHEDHHHEELENHHSAHDDHHHHNHDEHQSEWRSGGQLSEDGGANTDEMVTAGLMGDETDGNVGHHDFELIPGSTAQPELVGLDQLRGGGEEEEDGHSIGHHHHHHGDENQENERQENEEEHHEHQESPFDETITGVDDHHHHLNNQHDHHHEDNEDLHQDSAHNLMDEQNIDQGEGGDGNEDLHHRHHHDDQHGEGELGVVENGEYGMNGDNLVDDEEKKENEEKLGECPPCPCQLPPGYKIVRVVESELDNENEGLTQDSDTRFGMGDANHDIIHDGHDANKDHHHHRHPDQEEEEEEGEGSVFNPGEEELSALNLFASSPIPPLDIMATTTPCEECEAQLEKRFG